MRPRQRCVPKVCRSAMIWLDVDRAPALVGLEDHFLAVVLLDSRGACEGQVAVEDADQTV